MHRDISKFLITSGISIKDAMKQLDSSHRKVLFLINKNKILLGSLTDGDVRRWILSDGKLDADVSAVCHPAPFSANEGFDINAVKKEILKNKYSAVPVVTSRGEIINILFWDELFEEWEQNHRTYRKLDNPVVIMAGGQGARLEPFTKVLPKPLIPIGDKTIIEIIINKFLDYSINHFYISVNHKAKIIKSYFEELSPSFAIDYIEEHKPLGTIGALSYLKGKIDKPIFITNCDIIIDIDYAELLDFHINNRYDISLVASMMYHKIPYGICEIEAGGTLTKFSEKPEYSFLASTGMYVVNSDLLELIPQDTFYHITHLMEVVRERGGRIGVFPISENSWFDTGEWHEYKKTLERFKL